MQLLSNKTDSKKLERAWALDQSALFNSNAQKRKKLWSDSLLIARNLLKKYKSKSQDRLQILSKIGLIYMHQKKFYLAEKYFKITKQETKDDPIVMFNFGNLYRAMEQSKKAIYFYEKSIKLAKKLNGGAEIFSTELDKYRKLITKKKPA